jgi:hypothetical protein
MDCENGQNEVLALITQVGKHLSLERIPEQLMLWNFNDCSDTSANPSAVLREMVLALNPALVVIDPLYGVFNELERDNQKTTEVFQTLRGIMRDANCGFIAVHHQRKTDHERGEQRLDNANLSTWFQSARGPRALINGSDVRIGVDRVATNDSQVVVRGFERLAGEFPTIRLVRAFDDDGEPTGYNRLTGADLLSNPEQQAAYRQLPNEFRFKDAMRIYSRNDQPTMDFLNKCRSAGLLVKAQRGLYRKPSSNSPIAIPGVEPVVLPTAA